jgi:hypothetical protein
MWFGSIAATSATSMLAGISTRWICTPCRCTRTGVLRYLRRFYATARSNTRSIRFALRMIPQHVRQASALGTSVELDRFHLASAFFACQAGCRCNFKRGLASPRHGFGTKQIYFTTALLSQHEAFMLYPSMTCDKCNADYTKSGEQTRSGRHREIRARLISPSEISDFHYTIRTVCLVRPPYPRCLRP